MDLFYGTIIAFLDHLSFVYLEFQLSDRNISGVNKKYL